VARTTNLRMLTDQWWPVRQVPRFVASEWPGGSTDERCRAWQGAQHAWDDAHPNVLAVDYVELVRFEIAECRRVHGWPTR